MKGAIMPIKKVVKDKVYYMAKETATAKNDWCVILDVSDVTLRNWSYNPDNVSPEMRDRIVDLIYLWDKLFFRVEKVDKETSAYLLELAENHLELGTSCALELQDIARQLRWRITWYDLNQKVVYLKDDPFSFVHDILEAARGSYDLPSQLNRIGNGVRKQRVRNLLRNGTLSKIAGDAWLEIPAGTTVWDERLTKKWQVEHGRLA